jgi:hypothetical protein
MNLKDRTGAPGTARPGWSEERQKSRRKWVVISIAVLLVAASIGSLDYLLTCHGYCPGKIDGVIFGVNSTGYFSTGSAYWYNFTFEHQIPLNLTVSQLTFSVRNISDGPPGSNITGVHNFTLEYSNMTRFAVENASSGAWTVGSGLLVPRLGSFSVEAGRSLAGDGVVMVSTSLRTTFSWPLNND